MTELRSTARPALRWLLALLTGGLVALLVAQPAAAADNTLTSSTPAEGATLDQSPAAITLTFATPLGTKHSVSMTCGPTGEAASPVAISTAILLSDRVTLSADVPPLPKGTCTVAWSVTDTSLQPAGSGTISFTIANDPVVTTTTAAATTTTVAGATPDTAVTTTTAATTPAPGGSGTTDSAATAESGSSSGPLGLFRLLSTLGLAALFGSLAVIALAWPEGVEYLVTVKFLRLTWILTLVATALFAGALTSQITGDGLGASLMPTAWGGLMDSRAGAATLVRFLSVAATGYVVLRPERAIDPANQPLALAPPAIAVCTIAFSRDQFGMIELGVGLLHSAAMAVWLGGLVLMIQVVLSGPGEEDLVHAVRGFGRLSVPALMVTVATGVGQMFLLDQGAIFDTSHGRVLIIKALFVALMVFVALETRRFINQRASRARAMTVPLAARLRRALRIETVLGVVVLLFTSWLLALTPAGLVDSGSSAFDLRASHRFANSSLSADIGVAFSESVGANDVRIDVYAPATGLTGLEVDFIPPPASGGATLTILNLPLTGSGAVVMPKSAGFVLGIPGIWTVVVRVGTNIVGQTNVLVGGEAPATATATT